MGVYNRFGGKPGLEQALLTRGFDRLRATIAATRDADPALRLRDAAIRYRDFALENPHRYAFMFAATNGPHLTVDAGRTSADAAFDALLDHLAYAGASREQLATAFWSALHGAVALELTGASRADDPRAAYDTLVDLLIRGLEPR